MSHEAVRFVELRSPGVRPDTGRRSLFGDRRQTQHRWRNERLQHVHSVLLRYPWRRRRRLTDLTIFRPNLLARGGRFKAESMLRRGEFRPLPFSDSGARVSKSVFRIWRSGVVHAPSGIMPDPCLRGWCSRIRVPSCASAMGRKARASHGDTAARSSNTRTTKLGATVGSPRDARSASAGRSC